MAEHRGRLYDLTGEKGRHLLDDAFLRHFFRSHEPFFPVTLRG
ncbi:MAG: hypothetical protein QOF00_1424 [Pseudonocardiales bacterium]|jgi:hypothetical protein|nr:hypothetical protein [Pseudonocardiales bacterium]